MPSEPTLLAEDLLRELAPRVLGALTRRCGDFATAEDALAEALLAAVVEWKRTGLPGNPGGWVFQVACRRLTDRRRSDAARARRESESARHEVTPVSIDDDSHEFGEDPGDVLRTLFLCCHPALPTPSAIALTLRAVGGLLTSEIARAFLVSEATLAQRISRAKEVLEQAGAKFELPATGALGERLVAVRHVIYLMFNEAHVASHGDGLQRLDLANEAIRLARLLRRLVPADHENTGLLALLLLTDSRRAARTGPQGELIPLDEQERSRWDRGRIDEGLALLDSTLSDPTHAEDLGVYRIQAAIAAHHALATSVEATDWRAIVGLYDRWLLVQDHPFVKLNRAIALAMVDGPRAGLEAIAELDADPRITGHFRLDAVRGHLFERDGDRPSALVHYRAAAHNATNAVERAYLERKAARLE